MSALMHCIGMDIREIRTLGDLPRDVLAEVFARLDDRSRFAGLGSTSSSFLSLSSSLPPLRLDLSKRGPFGNKFTSMVWDNWDEMVDGNMGEKEARELLRGKVVEAVASTPFSSSFLSPSSVTSLFFPEGKTPFIIIKTLCEIYPNVEEILVSDFVELIVDENEELNLVEEVVEVEKEVVVKDPPLLPLSFSSISSKLKKITTWNYRGKNFSLPSHSLASFSFYAPTPFTSSFSSSFSRALSKCHRLTHLDIPTSFSFSSLTSLETLIFSASSQEEFDQAIESLRGRKTLMELEVLLSPEEEEEEEGWGREDRHQYRTPFIDVSRLLLRENYDLLSNLESLALRGDFSLHLLPPSPYPPPPLPRLKFLSLNSTNETFSLTPFSINSKNLQSLNVIYCMNEDFKTLSEAEMNERLNLKAYELYEDISSFQRLRSLTLSIFSEDEISQMRKIPNIFGNLVFLRLEFDRTPFDPILLNLLLEMLNPQLLRELILHRALVHRSNMRIISTFQLLEKIKFTVLDIVEVDDEWFSYVVPLTYLTYFKLVFDQSLSNSANLNLNSKSKRKSYKKYSHVTIEGLKRAFATKRFLKKLSLIYVLDESLDDEDLVQVPRNGCQFLYW